MATPMRTLQRLKMTIKMTKMKSSDIFWNTMIATIITSIYIGYIWQFCYIDPWWNHSVESHYNAFGAIAMLVLVILGFVLGCLIIPPAYTRFNKYLNRNDPQELFDYEGRYKEMAEERKILNRRIQDHIFDDTTQYDDPKFRELIKQRDAVQQGIDLIKIR